MKTKFAFLLLLAILLSSCASGLKPSNRTEPAVTESSINALGGLVKKVKRTLYSPAPKPLSFTLEGEWNIKVEFFSLEKNLAANALVKKPEHIELRGMNIADLYRDPGFTIKKDASEEAFILYYLKWDHDYWLSKSAALREGKTIGPVFNSDKHYGTIKVVKGDYQRCVFAARVDDAIYMMTGKAESSEKDICDTEAEIWESRDTY